MPAYKIRLASYINGRTRYSQWFDDTPQLFDALASDRDAREKLHGHRSHWVEEMTPTGQLLAHYPGSERHRAPSQHQLPHQLPHQAQSSRQPDDYATAQAMAALYGHALATPSCASPPVGAPPPPPVAGGTSDFGGGGAGGDF